MKIILRGVLLAVGAVAFRHIAENADIPPHLHNEILNARQQSNGGVNCPYNPPSLHVPAVPWDPRFPYNYAKNGLPGARLGGYQVPAVGDTAHRYIPPGPNDIRGPCPGMNTLANHGFIARDGITNYNELMDAQQNVFNVGYDLAKILTVIAISHDGDVVTRRLSIGCDATSRTSWLPLLTGTQLGLNGHNKFEMDTSLSRNDYFQANGDNYSFNGTLFKAMGDLGNRDYNRDTIADYKYVRYKQGIAENPNFYFGPLGLILYGAASLTYATMPNGNRGYVADHETISSFYGAQDNPDGSISFNGGERIPANWTNRATPYDLADGVREILYQFTKHPVLIGGKTGPGVFNVIDWQAIKQGKVTAAIGKESICLIYQLATGFPVPGVLNGVLQPAVGVLNFVNDLLGADMKDLGCPLPLLRK